MTKIKKRGVIKTSHIDFTEHVGEDSSFVIALNANMAMRAYENNGNKSTPEIWAAMEKMISIRNRADVMIDEVIDIWTAKYKV